MKKKLLLICLFLGAASLYADLFPAKSGYEKLPETPVVYTVIPDEVTFTMDKVIDKDVADQIYNICDTFLEYDENTENTVLYLKIAITQRAFFYKVEQKNAVYVSYSLTDYDGNIYLNKGIYYETRSSVVSSKEQYSIANKVIKDVNNYTKKSASIKVKDK